MNMQILAPAGSKESLQAAVRCGTDAVYLGASSFNARRNADNFDAFSLSEAVRYCHGRSVRVYVTLNTLIFNNEIKKFVSCLEEVLDAGPDCLIIQDLGVLNIIRSICPEIPLCASTQMAICNVAGAKALEDLGIHQAVLARELSLDEIAFIHSQTDISLETFVHGAHCMSVSGLCYFSSALGERSGNRGLCAQPCRMDFRCKGREYALSLKDLSFVTHIKELYEAGVSSLKIEGRMKRPEYVAASVTAVKKALHGEKPDMEDLRKVFSRSGFTDGYLIAKRNASMFGVRSYEDITASKETLGRMASLYRHELSNVPVDIDLRINKDIISLTVSDGVHSESVGSKCIPSNTGKITVSIAERSLKKTGNTPFIPKNVNIAIEDELSIPSSCINLLKKQALDALLDKRSVGIEYARKHFSPEPAVSLLKPTCADALRARFAKIDQIISTDKFESVIVPLEEIQKCPDVLKQIHSLWCELPTVIWPGTEKTIIKTLSDLYDRGLRDVTVGNIGNISWLRNMGFRVHGDATLNITNSYSLKYYMKLGLTDTLVSSELTLKQSEELSHYYPVGIISYGRLPLMFFRSCPARSVKGCEKCDGKSEITDRLHNRFPILCHQKQYSVMHNSVPLYLGDITLPPMRFYEFYFTTETKPEVVKIINSFAEKNLPSASYTRGHAFNCVR